MCVYIHIYTYIPFILYILCKWIICIKTYLSLCVYCKNYENHLENYTGLLFLFGVLHIDKSDLYLLTKKEKRTLLLSLETSDLYTQ